MDTIDRARIQELLRESDDLPHGATRIGIVEEAVRLADMLADVDLAYDARTNLIESANFGGAPEKALVAFTWCLAQLDKDPERFNEFYTLWQYKWVISSLPAFPQLSRAQIEAALADLGRRVEQTGFGMRPVYKLQYGVAKDMGEKATIHERYALWQKTPRGDLSDCLACELAAEVSYLIESDRGEEAIRHAAPILSGTRRCTSVPHTTLSNLLLPLATLGRFEEAVTHHLKGYRLIAGNRSYLFNVGQHIEFLALTGNLARGLKLFETHLCWSLETFDLFDRFAFSTAARFLFDRLRDSEKKTTKLRLPSTFPLFEASGKYAVAELCAWLAADSADLAARFDARNGNDAFARKIEASRRLESLVTPFPLRKPRKPRPD